MKLFEAKKATAEQVLVFTTQQQLQEKNDERITRKREKPLHESDYQKQ